MIGQRDFNKVLQVLLATAAPSALAGFCLTKAIG